MTPRELRDHFDYAPETGVLIRRKTGKEAGCLRLDGYREVSIENKRHLVHRVIWALGHGEWPTMQIDHINGIRADNRIANLRLATHGQNVMNQGHRRTNRLGIKGVVQTPTGYRAQLVLNGKSYNRRFKSLAEAVAYRQQLESHHGEFAYKPQQEQRA